MLADARVPKTFARLLEDVSASVLVRSLPCVKAVLCPVCLAPDAHTKHIVTEQHPADYPACTITFPPPLKTERPRRGARERRPQLPDRRRAAVGALRRAQVLHRLRLRVAVHVRALRVALLLATLLRRAHRDALPQVHILIGSSGGALFRGRGVVSRAGPHQVGMRTERPPALL